MTIVVPGFSGLMRAALIRGTPGAEAAAAHILQNSRPALTQLLLSSSVDFDVAEQVLSSVEVSLIRREGHHVMRL
jgi:hypothetical protein